MAEPVRVWLVERTYSDDEQNIIILTYAAPDGEREFRKERALPSFAGTGRETRVSLEVDPNNLGVVDNETRERYADEVERVRDRHGLDDTV
jgi:hypothetical protein